MASAFSLLLFAWVWHGLFVPRSSKAEQASPSLRVMTYNVLGTQTDYQSSIENIRAAHADVVFLQEVNPDFAARIASDLAKDFPFQVLAPRPGVNGMATISKFPLQETGESLGLVWVGIPQLMTLDWIGTQLGLINFHTLPPRLSWEEYMRENFRIRNEQARVIASYVERHADGPMVCAGDLNAVQVSTAYQTLRMQLNDAWLDGAVGFGNTFPNDKMIPPRMFRIDYILPSSRLTTVRAFLAPNAGGSDHRGVVADLVIANVRTHE
jgi:endonuclease/exonuclease/phosphatase (EEP) superfamily protein YafD